MLDGRIHPSALREHRKTHHVLGPSCLCPLLEPGLLDSVESAIYIHPDWMVTEAIRGDSGVGKALPRAGPANSMLFN
jgi:hypothetical protein